MFETDKTALGKNIKEHRKNKHLTQFELAEKIGLNEKQIYRIEAGLNYPTYQTFIKLIEILDINISDLKKEQNAQTCPILNQINKLLKQSNTSELKIYLEVLKTLKKNLKSFE